MMNDNNQISKETKLFGYIGEFAGTNRFSAVINKKFKENGKDSMMIPMNIRADDLYFTVSNMKESHVNGAVISNEYVTEVLDLLDSSNGMVQRSGMCDIIYKEGKTLRGDIFSLRVLTEYLKDLRAEKVAIIGTNHYAKAFSFLACGFSVSYFNDNLEALMAFTQEVEISNADINRLAEGMSVDMSEFDVLLDFSDFTSLDMISALPLRSLDMKNSKEFSALKECANHLNADYIGYEDMLENLTDKAYEEIIRFKI